MVWIFSYLTYILFFFQKSRGQSQIPHPPTSGTCCMHCSNLRCGVQAYIELVMAFFLQMEFQWLLPFVHDGVSDIVRRMDWASVGLHEGWEECCKCALLHWSSVRRSRCYVTRQPSSVCHSDLCSLHTFLIHGIQITCYSMKWMSSSDHMNMWGIVCLNTGSFELHLY